MRRRKDGELAAWWMLLCRGCRLSTTKVNKSEQREGLCARSSVVREIQWICRLPESTLVSRTGVRTERLIKKKKRKNRILYFKHSAVHLLSLFFFSPHHLHKMPGFRSSYSVQFKPGCSFGRTPDLQPLKSASSVQ